MHHSHDVLAFIKCCYCAQCNSVLCTFLGTEKSAFRALNFTLLCYTIIVSWSEVMWIRIVKGHVLKQKQANLTKADFLVAMKEKTWRSVCHDANIYCLFSTQNSLLHNFRFASLVRMCEHKGKFYLEMHSPLLHSCDKMKIDLSFPICFK